MSELDAKIDHLYRQPLGEFTAARNGLAKSLTGADAQRVRTLAKPTVVPWAVNQVYWHARATHDRLIKSGEQLRKAQIAALEGRSTDLRAVGDAHRRAVAGAVAEAERIASAAGSPPGADALARTFEALSLATQPPASPGRLTQPLQPAGFEALGGVRLQPERAESSHGPAKAGRHLQSDGRHLQDAGRHLQSAGRHLQDAGRHARKDVARERAAAEAARRREAEIKAAEATLARAEAEEQRARAGWERMHDDLLEARRALSNLKSKPESEI